MERAPQTRSHSANFEDEPSPSRCLLANSTFTIGGTADMSASGPSGFSQEAVERATESDAGIATVAGDSNLGSSIAASGVQLDWQGMPDDIKHLQKHNLEPSNLLLLLYHLAGCACPIERELLTYCGKPKMRWTQSGEQELFSARNLGLDAKVMILLQDETLERSLTLLETYRLIKRDSRKIALERKSARCIESLIGSQGQVSNYWKRQTFILTCFFFAGSEFSHKYDYSATEFKLTNAFIDFPPSDDLQCRTSEVDL